MILHPLFLCLLCLLCFFNPTTTSELCFDSHCNGNPQTVRFPFWIKNQQPKSCGYPGFDLSCHATGQPLVRLPASGDFSVQYIDYRNQEIRVNDPNNCLPRKIMSLNLSGSPFVGKDSEDFTFFNCSSNDQLPYGFNLNPISCLSGLSYAVFASSSPLIYNVLATSCAVMKTVSVPVSLSHQPELRDDLRLAWKNPNCGSCESHGRGCGLKPNSSTNEILCTYNPQPQRGLSRGARYAVCIGVGVPATLCVLGLLCCFCGRVSSYSRGRNSSIEAHWIVSSQPTPTMGLDGPTIDSFPKLVLGQSLRLPEPNDSTCPICLSEYRPKETVKTIPQCQHCFHQQCIDEWLPLNASCPVCRNSPIKSPFSDPHPLLHHQSTD